MVHAVVFGWFVYQGCGLVAGCTGCVEVPDTSNVHLCGKHQRYAALNGLAERMVWATDESAR